MQAAILAGANATTTTHPTATPASSRIPGSGRASGGRMAAKRIPTVPVAASAARPTSVRSPGFLAALDLEFIRLERFRRGAMIDEKGVGAQPTLH